MHVNFIINLIFVFHFVIQKYKDWNTQQHNFVPCFYGCESWSITFRVERKLRVLENRLRSNMFGLKRDEVTRGENYLTGSLMIYNPH